MAEESNTEESGNEVGENDESFAETNEANEEITINGWKSVNLIERDVFTGKHVSFKEGVLSQLNTPRSTFLPPPKKTFIHTTFSKEELTQAMDTPFFYET